MTTLTQSRASTKPTPPTIIRVALYTRVSTDIQASKEEGSLETQEARLRAAVLARSGHCEIVQVFREEGESGKSLDRPALQRMLDQVRKGGIDLLMVTRIDRLSRSLLDFYEMHRLFETHHVQFVSLNETFDTSSAVGRAMLKLVLVFAELEREQTAERTRLAIQARAERGLWNGGPPPLGYDSEQGGHLRINEAESSLVKLIFEKYLELRSSHKVTGWLNTSGYRQKRYVSRRKGVAGGNVFQFQSVRHVLTNRIYLGEIVHKGKVFPGQHQPIIDEATFERVQSLLGANTVVPNGPRVWAQYDYLLPGLVRCACGHALTSSSGRGNGGTYFYYRCTGIQKRLQHSCAVRQVRAEVVDELVMNVVRDAARSPELLARATAEVNRMMEASAAPLRARLLELKRELAEAQRQARDLVGSVLTTGLAASATAKVLLQEAELRQAQLREACTAAEMELAEASARPVNAEAVRAHLQDFDSSFEYLTLEEKREFLRLLIRQVTVEPERVVVLLNEGLGQGEEAEGGPTERETQEEKTYGRDEDRAGFFLSRSAEAAQGGSTATSCSETAIKIQTGTIITAPTCSSASSLTTEFVVSYEDELAPPATRSG